MPDKAQQLLKRAMKQNPRRGGQMIITVGRYILRCPKIAFVCFICCLVVSVAGAIGTVSVATSPKFTLMEHGPATVEQDTTVYYYLKGRVNAAALATLTFDAKNCVLIDKAGKKYSDCWISIAGWSKGFSTGRHAPIAMKTLTIKPASGGSSKPSTDWNTSKVVGPKGKLTYEIPAGGYATFYFLWPVPNGTVGASCHLAEIGDVKLEVSSSTTKEKADPSLNVIITGIMLNKDGTPSVGIDVSVYESTKSGGYSVKVGEGGVILNPRGTTSTKGKFTVKLERRVFKDALEFVILAEINSRYEQLRDKQGIPVVIKLSQSTKNVDLGTIRIQ